jgi:hypothetical protein
VGLEPIIRYSLFLEIKRIVHSFKGHAFSSVAFPYGRMGQLYIGTGIPVFFLSVCLAKKIFMQVKLIYEKKNVDKNLAFEGEGEEGNSHTHTLQLE